MKPALSPLMKFLRIVTGIIFVLAGGIKLLAAGGFGDVLAQSGTPAPRVFAVLIPLLEIGGGGALIANRFARLIAAVLAVNMIFAIALVGIPAERGAGFHAGDRPVGGEPWRMPLETGLLASLLLLALRPCFMEKLPGGEG